MKNTLINALLESGKIITDNYRKLFTTDYKQGNDIVTQVDLASEKLITEIIKRDYPSHNILAEESGELNADSQYTWVIDPLDGTKNYASGFPFFCVSIGLLKNNEVLMGGIYAPVTKELFFAEKGKGAYLNDILLKVNSRKPRDSLIAMDFNHCSKENKRQVINSLEAITNEFRSLRCIGSGALALAYVASSVLGAYVSLQASKWDKVAGSLIVKEAGGLVYGSLESKEPIIAVSNKESYNKIKELIGINTCDVI